LIIRGWQRCGDEVVSAAQMNRIYTHYDTLKVARDAPTEVIRSAYRALARKYHPDSNPDLEEAVKAMQELNQAFEVLIDPVQRKAHDEWIDQQSAEKSSATNDEAKKTGKFPHAGQSRANIPRADKLTPRVVVGIIAVAAALIALVIIALEAQHRSSSKNSPSSESTGGLAASPTPTTAPLAVATPTPTATPRPALSPEPVDNPNSEVERIPSIPNAWIAKHSLSPVDSNLPANDPDKDGFTNIEEFRAGSSPIDGNSRPPAWTKLRFVSAKTDKLRIKFVSLPSGDLETVQINTLSAEHERSVIGMTRFYKKGDVIVLSEARSDGREVQTSTPFALTDIRRIKRFNPQTNAEELVPAITLRSRADGLEIELAEGEIKDSPYTLATLKDLRPEGKEYSLRTGQQFVLDDQEKYKLVEVSAEAAVIQSLTTGEPLRIPLFEPEVAAKTLPTSKPTPAPAPSHAPRNVTTFAASGELLGTWIRDSDSTIYQFFSSHHGVWQRNSQFTVTHNNNENTFMLDFGSTSGWTNTIWFGADPETMEGYTQHGHKFMLKRIQ
jgi:curved DNA-binding protein CbpA